MAVPEKIADEAERRVAPRMRVLKRAKVIFNNGFSTLDCIVRNVSATGALLTLAESAHMPKEFQLQIGDDPVRPARLVYRRTMFAGVRYADIPDEDEEGHAPQTSLNAARSAASPTSRSAPSPQSQNYSEPNASGSIRKIKSERLPRAVLGNMPWTV